MKNMLIIIILFFVSSCTKSKIEANQNQLNTQQLSNVKKSSEHFDSFFKSFFSDKAFRLSHIKFPLQGFNSDEGEYDSKNKNYLWEKENWIFYSEEDFKTINQDKTKKQTIKNGSEVIYRIYKENSGYDIQYTFKKIDKKWMLVYYSYKNI